MYKIDELRSMAELERLLALSAANDAESAQSDIFDTKYPATLELYIRMRRFDAMYHELRATRLDDIADSAEGGK